MGDGFAIPWPRKMRGRRIAGVCRGLADRFGLPVLAFRLAFLIAALFAGWGLFLYLCLWLLMPVEEE